jgi:RNA polymerase sigma-70 factor (ECF subfamily)
MAKGQQRGAMDLELLDRARAGDEAAFGELVGPYRSELRLHCYRILGTLADAEDALQEAMLAAWRGLHGFEGRSSLRTWLYRIATTRALNLLRAGRPHPTVALAPDVHPPEPTRLGDVAWLQPYPNALLDDFSASPEGRYEAREAVSLAFVTALQLLPPLQRAALILCDVLDFPARDAAGMLDTTGQSVYSALQRARATLKREHPSADAPCAPAAGSPQEHALLTRFVDAFEAADVPGIVACLTEDAWVRMPPAPLEYQGRELAARFFATVSFRRGRRFRLVPTRANDQPAFGVYLCDPVAAVGRAYGAFVLTVAGGQVSALTAFDMAAFDHFGLPRTLAG